MSHWNYRVVRKRHGGEDFFEIHEVYYDDAGKPEQMTSNAVTFGGDTPEQVIRSLEMAIRDARDRPVFDPPAAWDGKTD